jgi:hypothetical protein
MSTRMLAALVSSWLPTLGVILPMSGAYRLNALIAGTLATVLAAFSVVDDRARYGAAALAAWTGLMFLVVDATIIELAVNGGWAVAMFTWLLGPFSASPAVTWVRPEPVRLAGQPAYEPVERAAA